MSLFARRSTATTLEGLRAEWADCKECPFYTQRKHVVMGEGKVGATIFAVGISPGRDEDKHGHPFSGKGGEVTKHQFALAQIPIDEVFWTNVIACMPFGWMQGVRQEFQKNCQDRLETELLIVKPKMIVAMGADAAKRFLPDNAKSREGEMRGRNFKYRGIPGITILHPAILNRLKGMEAKRKKKAKADVATDMARVKNLYQEVRAEDRGT